MSDIITEAYRIVLNDLLLNGSDMLKGIYDAKNGNDAFMYGIQTVMEQIAIRNSDDAYQLFTQMFTKNMVKSKEKASKKKRRSSK